MTETKPVPDQPKTDNTLPEEPKLSDEEKAAAKQKKEDYDKQMATVIPVTSPGAAPVLKDDLRAAKKKEADEEAEARKLKAKEEQERADKSDQTPRPSTAGANQQSEQPRPTTRGR